MADRINFEMGLMDIIMGMSEGNPGALNAIMGTMEINAEVDPDSALGNMGTVIMLDSFKIYGSDIWVLYKDVCGQSALNMIAIIRAVQMGIMDLADLKEAMKNCFFESERMAEVLEEVRILLPAFQKDAT